MSYEIFQKCEIGTVKELPVVNGFISFVKSGDHQWLVLYALKSIEPFYYTRFTTVMTEIEASCLYDIYSK